MSLDLDRDLKDIGLSRKVFITLKRAGFNSIGDIILKRNEGFDFSRVRLMGPKSINELENCLYHHGYLLKKPQDIKPKPPQRTPQEMVVFYEEKNPSSFNRIMDGLVRIGESYEVWVKRVNPRFWTGSELIFTEELAKDAYADGGIELDKYFIKRMLEYGDHRLEGTVIFERYSTGTK